MRSTIIKRRRPDWFNKRPCDYRRALLLAAMVGAVVLLALSILATHVEAGVLRGATQVARRIDPKIAQARVEPDILQQVNAIPATVTVPRLNVRLGPSTATRVIGQVKAGDVLTLVGRNTDGSWMQIQSPLQGWVSAQYIKLSGPQSALPVITDVAAPKPSVQRPAPSDLTGHVVFQEKSGGTLYVLDLATGEQRTLTSGAHPAISPDGKKVAFIRGGGDSGLWIIDLDGTNLYRIYEGNSVRTPTWSPDGRWIAFSRVIGYDRCRDLGPDGHKGEYGCVSDRPGLEGFPVVETPIRSLSRVDSNGNDFRDIASLQRAQAPSWSDDGIVYQDSSPSGLQLTDDSPDGTSRPVIAGFHNQDPEWQPGARRIVYQSEDNGKWQIVLINPDGSGRTVLTGPKSGASETTAQNVSPTWSPDGKHLLFLSDRGRRWQLWTMNPDGSGLKPLPLTVPIDYRFELEQVASWGP